MWRRYGIGSRPDARAEGGLGSREPAKSVDARAAAGPRVLVVLGPTGVGKSDMLFSVLDGRFEVINADSMQAYRGMDVGTAKPSAEQLARVPHHLISFLNPDVQYNAGEFAKRAEILVGEIGSRGKLPVVSGGTGFYVTGFLFGLPESPAGSAEMRARIRNREREQGPAALYEELIRRDPDAASRIHAGDRYRVVRALEILETSGRSVFSFGWPRTLRTDLRFLILGLDRPREQLYGRIDERVEQMFAEGLTQEVKGLIAAGYGPECPGMRGIGYREFFEMRKGCAGLADVKDAIKRDSRRYAKRQLTFLRSIPEVQWVDAEDAASIRALVEGFSGDGG